MSDLGLRYLVPGFAFWIPTILLLVLLGLVTDATVANLVTVMVATAVPVGFLLHHSGRVSTYDDELYARELRLALYRALDPGNGVRATRVLVSFDELNLGMGVRSLSSEAFSALFMYREQQTVTASDVRELRYVEPVGDACLFRDPSYEYGRSISTVRYVIDAVGAALLWGLLLAPSAVAFSLSRNGSADLRTFLVTLSVLLVAPLLITAIVASWRRRNFVADEYRARLLFSTLTQSRIRTFDPDRLLDDLPPPLATRVRDLGPGRGRLAVFDMDCTLLTDDVGERSLQVLDANVYANYLRMVHRDPAGAYRFGAQQVAAAGDEQSIRDLARRAIDEHGIRPRPALKNLLLYMQVMGFDCRIVTATNASCARLASETLLGVTDELAETGGIARKRILGIECRGGQIDEPAPLFDGKRDVVRRITTEGAPVLIAGDSANDQSLMRAYAREAILVVVDNEALFADLYEAAPGQAYLVRSGNSPA